MKVYFVFVWFDVGIVLYVVVLVDLYLFGVVYLGYVEVDDVFGFDKVFK